MVHMVGKIKGLLFCGLIMIFSFALADYPSVEANVPYAKVAELSHQAWHAKYQYGDHKDQYILHWPAVQSAINVETSSKRPIVFIHGGCWLEQFTIEHSLPLTSAFAQAGFEVFSVEYRRVGNGGEWPVALDDIMLALAHIQAKLSATKQEQSLTLIGHSAGGHLASLAALKASQIYQNIHFIGLAPIMNIEEYAKGENSCQTATPSFMQGSPDAKTEAYKQANPIYYDLRKLASAKVFAGGKDTIVPLKYAQHKTTTLSFVVNAGHFDWIHPGSQAFKRVLAHLEATTVINANTH